MSTENFNKIYTIFTERFSNYIVNDTKLKEYIYYCLTKAVNNAIKLTTSYHHILPKSKQLPFEEFQLLSANIWNGVHLSYYDHYYAHFLLQQATNHPSILYAFTAMHHKDSKIGRIKEDELIDSAIFNKLMRIRNQNISNNMNRLVDYKGELITNASKIGREKILSEITKYKMHVRMAGKNNIVHKIGVVDKIRKTKATTKIDGKNLDTISAERAAFTMKQEFVNDKGEVTTQYKENGKKISEFLKTTVELPDGTITTNLAIRSKLHQNRLQAKSQRHILKNVFDDTYSIILPAYEIRKLSPGLLSKTKEKYLGKSKFGQTQFIRTNREHLIGLYVEELQ